jgi:hypothetical protein
MSLVLDSFQQVSNPSLHVILGSYALDIATVPHHRTFFAAFYRRHHWCHSRKNIFKVSFSAKHSERQMACSRSKVPRICYHAREMRGCDANMLQQHARCGNLLVCISTTSTKHLPMLSETSLCRKVLVQSVMMSAASTHAIHDACTKTCQTLGK